MSHTLDRAMVPLRAWPHGAVSPWLAFHRPQPDVRVRLFCFPYAGGGAWLFRKWQAQVPAGVEICAIELPGRGRRFAERPFRRLEPAVATIAASLAPYLKGVPCAFFGHSMGALLAFELALALESTPGADVRGLFVSATRSPTRRLANERTYALPDSELIEVLRGMRKTPHTALDDTDVLQLMLPCVRADIELAQTYRFAGDTRRLRCPVRAFGGRDDDDVPRADLEAWREVTHGPFALQMFGGGHFFVAESEAEVLQAVAKGL